MVFDLGNVLIPWDPRRLYLKLFHGDAQAVEHFLKEIEFFAWNRHHDVGRSFAEGVAELCRRFPHYCDLIRAYDERYPESLGEANEAVVQIVKALKQAGYPLYALSNWPAEKYHQVRHRFPFLEWFEAVIISGEVGLAKPDPRIFHLALQRIGRPAEECLFIDDSAENIAVAHSLGFRTVHFTGAESLRQALRPYLE